VIGACDLSFIERNVVDLGYMLGSRIGGKGYAAEIALALVDAGILRSATPSRDLPGRHQQWGSIRVLEKIGMRWKPCSASIAARRIAGGTVTSSY